jgi:hypothetical protein
MLSDTISKERLMDWVIRIGGFIMSIAIAISTFFLTEAWKKISNIEEEVNGLKVTTTHLKDSRLTVTDWISAKTVLDSERLALDRRLIRMEESLPIIKESLIEIKQTLKENR